MPDDVRGNRDGLLLPHTVGGVDAEARLVELDTEVVIQLVIASLLQLGTIG
jgi:hypothetical protein